jgi:hypothetical protein
VSRLGLLPGWRRCSLFVTQFAHDPVVGVLPVICPCEEAGASLASACWPDQKPVRRLPA